MFVAVLEPSLANPHTPRICSKALSVGGSDPGVPVERLAEEIAAGGWPGNPGLPRDYTVCSVFNPQIIGYLVGELSNAILTPPQPPAQ